MGRGADLAWSRLPDYMVAADDGTLAAYLAATADQMNIALDTLTIADPNTSVTGTCEIADPARAPRGTTVSGNWLAWLGRLVGVDTTAYTDAETRAAVANATSTQRRGSVAAIVYVTQTTLTGSKSCRVYSNLSGVDPYLITVITSTSQTPDSVATLEAALQEKPAGADLELQVVDGATFAEIEANFANFAAVEAGFTDFTDMLNYTP